MWERIKKNKLALGVTAIILIGLILTVIISRQPTNVREHASGTGNLNTAESITSTNNPNGTMGPSSWTGNYSNSLPQKELGTLIFMVSDPSSNRPSFPTSIPPESPSVTRGKSNASANGPLAVTSLIVKISKIEVHLAFLGAAVTPTPKPVDHWETLKGTFPMSVDLAQLAKGGVASLGLTSLAGGKYTEVRLYISNATATLSDGTNVTLTILGKDNIVRVVEPFNITAGKNTTLVMDFDASKSVIGSGNGKFLLKPVVSKFLENSQ